MYQVRKKNDSVYVVDKVVQCHENYLGFGAEVYDFMNGTTNKCGVYLLQLTVDNIPRFMFKLDAISFVNSRFVNAHMDYELKTEQSKSVHRLFLLPNNSLPIYSYTFDKGLIYLSDDSVHQCKIEAVDAYGNSSVLQFTCKSDFKNSIVQTLPEYTNLINWDVGGNYKELFRLHSS